MIFEEVKIVSEFYSSFLVTLPLYIGATAFGTGAFLLILYALRVLPSGRAGGSLTTLGILFLLASAGGYVYTTTIGKVSLAERVPLSTVDSKIHVDGNKVTIEPLDGKYSTTQKFDGKQTEQKIYDFKYDEFYKQGWLIDSGGREIKLDNDDSEYLKSKQK